jgi:hypothetical protein
MNGAREYAEIFGVSQQHGKLFISVGSHARGKTFHVYISPDESPYSFSDMAEVYGIISGQPGWTETYGWIHRGPWEEDFAKLLEATKKEWQKRNGEEEERKRLLAEAKKLKIETMLKNY